MASIIGVETLQHTNGTTAATIDSSGNVEINGKLSHDYVYGQGSQGSTTSAGNSITLDTNRDSSGGVTFEDSNVSIKVPVAGLYLIGYHVLGDLGSGNLDMHINKNGTMIAGSKLQDTNSTNDNASAQVLEVLAANDKISWYINSGASHGNVDYNNFFVVKLG